MTVKRTPNQSKVGARYVAPDGTVWKKVRALERSAWEAAFWAAAADARVAPMMGERPDTERHMTAMGYEKVPARPRRA